MFLPFAVLNMALRVATLSWDATLRDPPGIPPPAKITLGTIVPMTVEPAVVAVPPPGGLHIKAGLTKRDNEATPMVVHSPPDRGGAHAILLSQIRLIMWCAASIGWGNDVFLCWLK